jgi:hypothetical protein
VRLRARAREKARITIPKSPRGLSEEILHCKKPREYSPRPWGHGESVDGFGYADTVSLDNSNARLPGGIAGFSRSMTIYRPGDNEGYEPKAVGTADLRRRRAAQPGGKLFSRTERSSAILAVFDYGQRLSGSGQSNR